MSGEQFDAFTQAVAGQTSRRGMLKALLGGSGRG
jgi:hypothetical protein